MSRPEEKDGLTAYFCAEFAVEERLPIYAGGLGVLAGDHVKTAGDLGLPLVAVGLLYAKGYFTQHLDAAGWQQADSAVFDPAAAGCERVVDAQGQELRVRVPLAEHGLQARLWRKQVGKIPLYLLDAGVPENTLEDRHITARLYEAGSDIRLKQEILLGIGGVRALRALGLQPAAWHINEGHAAFLVLERVREHVAAGYGFDAALEAVAAATVFTTHTAVAAGHDSYSHRQLEYWLHEFIGALHTTERRFFALGAAHDIGDRFSMTALALRGARSCNGVSKIHGDLAQRMEFYAWPEIPPGENPIGHVTNGVHLPTFLAAPWKRRLEHAAPAWRTRVLAEDELRYLDALPDEDVREVRRELRGELIDGLRARTEAMHARLGTPHEVLARLLDGLERARGGTALIGFARRFATYKRATLLLSDPGRLARLLGHERHPAVLVFAGKAHPHDGGGQELIHRLFEASLRPEFAGRLLVVEGYDLALARLLVAGCDAWLNTPEYPLEASGTSGMKSAINGGINVSILDGWWAEGFREDNGFALTPAREADPARRDALEAQQLFDLLEQRVLPEYYGDAAGAAVPSAAWLRRARRSMQTVAAHYSSARMVSEYRERYRAVAERGRQLEASNGRSARHLARWKRLVRQQWPGVQLRVEPGAPLRVTVTTNGLPPDYIVVQAVHRGGQRQPLRLESGDHQSACHVLEAPGDAPVEEVRAYPHTPLLSHPFEMGLLRVLRLA